MHAMLLRLSLGALLLAASGCQSLQDMADEPYRKAIKGGRMSPGEYQKQQMGVGRTQP